MRNTEKEGNQEKRFSLRFSYPSRKKGKSSRLPPFEIKLDEELRPHLRIIDPDAKLNEIGVDIPLNLKELWKNRAAIKANLNAMGKGEEKRDE